MPRITLWARSQAVVSRSQAVQTAILQHQASWRCTCRQAKQWVWPAARTWHTLTGWPQASVEEPREPALLQAAVSALLRASCGAGNALLGCLYGKLYGDAAAAPGREAAEAVGEVLAMPLHAVIDLVGIAGATLLLVLSMLLDTCGAAVGTLVGTLTAPRVAYRTGWA